MGNRKSMRCLLGFVLMCAHAAAAADAPTLSFRFSKVDIPGALQTFPGGVNNHGVSVGEYQDKNGLYHGYILDGKKLTTLDDPKSKHTAAFGINLNGPIMVVGLYINSSGNQVGFLYKDGKFTDIPGPKGAIPSVAGGINDNGDIVGLYNSGPITFHGFLLKGGTYTTLDVPGASGTIANGINKTGKIVLQWLTTSGNFEAALYNGKTYKKINVPGATQSAPDSINTEGDVIYCYAKSLLAHGALLHAGKYYKFDYPKTVETLPSGINDDGMIVGSIQLVNNGPWHGFRATYK